VVTAKIQKGTHDKCLAVTVRGGRTLVCWRSPGHDKSSDPQRRLYYDPSTEETWTD
jgi:hypothetical protein